MVLYAVGAALFAAAAALFWLFMRQTRRLQKLAQIMETDLTTGGHSLSFSLREDAVAPVENAAAEMENRIIVLRERCQEEARRVSGMTADISHQLKTPLSSLRLFCEMDEGPHLNSQLDQIERMEKLIASLLRLEKLCADGYAFTYADQPLRPIIENAWARLSPLWPGRKLILQGGAHGRCDGKWLGEAFENLLKNACQHTGEDGEITVKLDQTSQVLFCSLEDNGGGVSPQDLPHLFDRFYRVQGQQSQGAGLGLAIVKEIIFRHHGQIIAENAKCGLKFRITMPALYMNRGQVP